MCLDHRSWSVRMRCITWPPEEISEDDVDRAVSMTLLRGPAVVVIEIV